MLRTTWNLEYNFICECCLHVNFFTPTQFRVKYNIKVQYFIMDSYKKSNFVYLFSARTNVWLL